MANIKASTVKQSLRNLSDALYEDLDDLRAGQLTNRQASARARTSDVILRTEATIINLED